MSIKEMLQNVNVFAPQQQRKQWQPGYGNAFFISLKSAKITNEQDR